MLKISTTDDTAVVVIEGHLTYAETGAFAGSLRELTESSFSACLIDLTRLDFMDSSGLRMIFSLHDFCRERKFPMKLRGSKGQPLELLMHCRVDLLMQIEEAD